MIVNESILRRDEKAVFGLRSLYQRYGYIQYRMNKFEEYDLYVRNKDFLISDRVITFTDTNGKLMALKPDVTFSIIKNTEHHKGFVQKLYYNENVYRTSSDSLDFKEIMQTGLECIGDTDIYNICEVLFLASSSLGIISNNYILDISHMGFVEGLLEELQITDLEKEAVYKCLGEKNAHGIESILGNKGNIIISLIHTYGDADEVLVKLRKISSNEKTKIAIYELENIIKTFKENGMYKNVRLDFSVINNMNYYNGIVFQGFIDGISTGILSGGQYDKLMHKMGKKSKAIGFAVYLDLLQRYNTINKEYDIDTLIVYEENTDLKYIVETVKSLIDKGDNVLVQRSVPPNIKYKNILRLKDEVQNHD